MKQGTMPGCVPRKPCPRRKPGVLESHGHSSACPCVLPSPRHRISLHALLGSSPTRQEPAVLRPTADTLLPCPVRNPDSVTWPVCLCRHSFHGCGAPPAYWYLSLRLVHRNRACRWGFPASTQLIETDPNLDTPLRKPKIMPFELYSTSRGYSETVVPLNDHGIEGLV